MNEIEKINFLLKGWEEIVAMSVTNMLRIGISKSSSKDQGSFQTTQGFKLPEDSSKLEKQLKSLISKLQTGASLQVDVYKPMSSQAVSEAAVGSVLKEEKSAGRAGGSRKSNQDWDAEERFLSSENSKAVVYERDSESGEQVTKKVVKKPVAKNNDIPTFEELMESENFTSKTSGNFESDEDD